MDLIEILPDDFPMPEVKKIKTRSRRTPPRKWDK